MVSCGGDVALAFRDRTIVLSVPSFKLAERLAIRTALDVVNAWFGMPKLSFRKRQERTIETHFGSIKSIAPFSEPDVPGMAESIRGAQQPSGRRVQDMDIPTTRDA